MPFSNHAVNAEAMRSALQKVCQALGLNCAAEDPMTELVISKIVALTEAGETDPDCLCTRVLAELGHK
jgi:hypothetical protein